MGEMEKAVQWLLPSMQEFPIESWSRKGEAVFPRKKWARDVIAGEQFEVAHGTREMPNLRETSNPSDIKKITRHVRTQNLLSTYAQCNKSSSD
jgi:hypothetical protein